ncbi:10937_t:CDS:2, partial [Funneliformis mosseae]
MLLPNLLQIHASIRNQQKPKQKQVYSTQQNFEQKLEEPISANQKVFAEITKVLEVDGARKVPTKFSINNLLEYEKSKEFRSLNAKSKSAVKFRINVMLRDELSKNNKLSQPISIYAARGIIPELPKGIKCWPTGPRLTGLIKLDHWTYNSSNWTYSPSPVKIIGLIKVANTGHD